MKYGLYAVFEDEILLCIVEGEENYIQQWFENEYGKSGSYKIRPTNEEEIKLYEEV